MTTIEKLAALHETYSDSGTFSRVVDKLLETALSQHRQRLQRYLVDCKNSKNVSVWTRQPSTNVSKPANLAMQWISLNGQGFMN